MITKQIYNDIVTDHRARMLNIVKYYPFFVMSQENFETALGGRYKTLDMGYITMAVLRFFIEENNFKDKDVTYPEYVDFMANAIKRDFNLELTAEENKEVAGFVFDKIRNEGRPFVFDYYDPIDKKKRSIRSRIIESKIVDSTVYYSIGKEAIEFYLDTKEIREESKISIEQLLLEKLITAQDFSGGKDVVDRINEEVHRLEKRKEEVLSLLSRDVRAGIIEYESFKEHGMKWFEDEQKLFEKNMKLIKEALEKTEKDYANLDSEVLNNKLRKIHSLEVSIDETMHNHSKLLESVSILMKAVDDAIRKEKMGKLRMGFSFEKTFDKLIDANDYTLIERFIKPFFKPNLTKSFNFASINRLLAIMVNNDTEGEVVKKEKRVENTYPDEEEERRIEHNYKKFFEILIKLLESNKKISLNVYNDALRRICGEDIFRNGDYYSFLVNICQKKEYRANENNVDTFLDEIIKDVDFRGIKRILVCPIEDLEKEIEPCEGFCVSKIDFIVGD